jgi:Putative auto-transporter adhesin, head GIN domain
VGFLLVAGVMPGTARAWFDTEGSGNKVTQSREVPAFDAVRLKGSLDAKIVVGPQRAVSVTIDDNLQELVTTTVEDGTLVIETKHISYHGVGRVEISVPTMKALDLTGSGDVTIDGGSGDLRLRLSGSGDITWRATARELDVALSGSGDIKLAGKADVVTLRVSGSGDIDADSLVATSADVKVSGSGNVGVTLGGGTLRASISGSGDIVWHGTATVEEMRVHGSGSIERH